MAFINRFSTTQYGAIVITGNTLGLSKANNNNAPGTNDSIGGFITTNTALPVPSAWAGIVNLANGENITLNWQQNSSSAFLNMPSGSTVIYAELIWGGLAKTANVDVTASINNPILFTTPLGTTSVSPDPASSFNGSRSTTELWYSRSQNVTSLISNAGSVKYTAGAVPSALDPLNNSTNFAGWSLIVVYKNTLLPARNMTVFSGGEIVNVGATIDTTVSGFITPSSGTINARILVSAGEGDASNTGDFMAFGPNTSSLTKLFGPNNPANPPNSLNNFFGSQINIGNPNNANVGAIDTTGTFGNRNSNAFTGTNISGGRQGWDITNVNGSATLINGQTTATARFSSSSEVYMPNGLAIQIDTISADVSVVKTASPDPVIAQQTLTYTIIVANSGPSTAQNVVLSDVIPSTILSPEYSIDGGVTWNSWVTPYSIGTLVKDASLTIKIRGTVSPAAITTISNTATVNSTTPDSDTTNNTSTAITKVNTLADLSIIKTENPNPVIAGQLINYSMVVSNAGPSNALNVLLTDVVPAQILNPQYSIDRGVTWNIWASPYSIGTLGNGASVTIQIRGTVSPSATESITNTGTVSSTTPDPNPNNNTSTTVTQVNTSADISIVKIDNPDPVIAGQLLSYTMVVSNAGPSDAQNVSLSDVIPPEILNPEYSIDGGSNWNSWISPYSIGTLASGTSVSIKIRGTVSPSTTGSITNTGAVSSTTPDPNPNNNTSTVVTQVNTVADVSVLKTSSLNLSTLTYTVVISNVGPSDAQNVTLTDSIPNELSNPEYSIDGGSTWNPWISPYTIGTLGNNSSISIEIRGTVNSSTVRTISNTAIINSSTLDPNLNNNTSTVITKLTDVADISVLKIVNPSTLNSGQNLVYTIIVSNAGPDNAQNVTFTDTIPSEILNPEYSTDGGVTWNPWISPYSIGTLTNGSSISVQIRGKVNPSAPSGTISNTGAVNSSTPDPNPDNNTSTVLAQLNTLADISIIKQANPVVVTAGQLLTYTMTISNSGPSDAQNVLLTDAVPPEILNPEYSIDSGVTWNPWITSYSIGTLSSGSLLTIQIRGLVSSSATGGTITNTGTISSSTPDPHPEDNTSTVITQVNTSADIYVIKQDNPSPIIAGQLINYSILVSNAGPSNAQNVSLSDIVPAEILNPEYSVDGGVTWNPWVSPYAIGTLANGSSLTIQIRGTVSPVTIGGSITNTTTVSSTTPDPNLANNTSTIITQVNTSADISVIKTASPSPVKSGQVLTYSLVVSNSGLSDAQNVVLTDNVPSALSGVQFSTNGGSIWNTWASPYSIGTLANGDSVTILIRGTVSPLATGIITNTATIDSTTPDPNHGNNSSTVITGINSLADLSVVKTGSPNPVIAGQMLTYSILVSNLGPDDAVSVVLTDNILAILSNVEFSTDDGSTWNPWVSPYSIGLLTNGTSVTILIRGIVDKLATGIITNTTTINSITPDPTPENNTSTVITSINTLSDVSIVKTSSSNTIIAGEEINYSMLISNTGPNDAENVYLTDNIPPEILNPEFTIDNGVTWHPWVSPYSIGTLGNGTSVNIQVRGMVNPSATGSITNTGAVSSTTPDSNPNNNTSTVVIQVDTLADLSVVKTSSLNLSELTYTVVVSNVGPSDAQNVTLIDSIPTELSHTEYSTDGGATWNPWISPYTIGTLKNNASVIIEIKGTVNSGVLGTISNTAIINSTTLDPNPSNNISTVITKLTDVADVSVLKIVDPSTLNSGENLVYIIIVSNAGPDNAQNVTFTDTIPSEILNPEYSIDGGVTWNPWISPYSIGTLTNGSSISVEIRGKVNPSAPSGTISNTGAVNSSTPDPNPNNNTSTAVAQLNTSADISITKQANPVVVTAGQLLTYTMTISNGGASDAQDVFLTDTVPPEILNPEYSIDGGLNWNPWISPYSLGTLSRGSLLTVQIRGTVSPSTTRSITNTAKVSSTTPDPHPEDNTSTVITQVDTSADISVVKTDTPDPVIAGQSLMYTIVVSNAGPSNAQDVSLLDTVTPELLNPEYSIDGELTWNPWVSPYTIGTLTNGSSVSVQIRGTVSPSATGTITNTVTVNSSTLDPNPDNNTSTAVTQVNTLADVSVVKTSSLNLSTLTYTVVVSNIGPSDAQNVTLTDSIPTELSYIEYSTDGGATWNPWISPYTIGTLGNNASITIEIKGTVNSGAIGTISNTAIINSTTLDPNPNNNTSTVITKLTDVADVSVLKIVNPSTLNSGQNLVYTVIVSNAGPDDAQNVLLTDIIPSVILNPEYSTDGGLTWNPWISPYSIGTLTNGSSISLQIRGTVNPSAPSGTISNTSIVNSSTPDQNLDNNTSTALTQLNTSADISITKQANPIVVTAGQLHTYTMTISNGGSSDAQNVLLTDAVPTEILNPEYSIDGGLNWNPWISPYSIGTLSSGYSVTVEIRGLVSSSATGGTITNTATISSSTPDPHQEDNTSTVITQVNTSADISVIKQANPSPVIAGQLINYSMVVSNRGPSDAKNVLLTDTVPAELINSEYSIDGGASWNPVASPYSIGTLITGASLSIRIRGIVNYSVTGTITNTATVSSTTHDPDLADNTSTIITQVNTSADISVIKTASPSPVKLGQVLTYTLVVSNSGLSDAQNVVLTDNVPSALTSVQFSTDGGSNWNDWASPYSIGTLANGSSVTILIRGTVNPLETGTITNTATVDSITHDPNPENNTSTVITGINSLADLSVVKTASPNPVIAGQMLTYSILVSNLGPDDAESVVLTDNIPAILSSVEFSRDDGSTWNPWVSPYSIGLLTNGASVTILIRGIVDSLASGTITNTATINSITPDTNPENNSSTVITGINTLADISIVKTTSPSIVVAGETVTYTMIVSNSGPNDAKNVILTDNIPTALTGVQFSIDNGVNWDSWISPYYIGTLAKGNSVSIQIRGIVSPSATELITNTAIVSSTTPDSNPNNNTSTVVTQVDTLADVLVVKTSSLNLSELTYTVVVSNIGPSDAQNVTLTDSIPTELSDIEYSTDGGATWNPWISPYSIGTLKNNASVTIEIKGIVNLGAIGTITNTAIISSTTLDPNPSNNISTVITKLTDVADVSVLKIVNPSTLNSGENLVYTVIVSNSGPDNAKNVTLTDTIPYEILNPEYSKDGGVTWNPWISPYSIGTLTNGSSISVQIRGKVNPSAPSGTISNTGAVNSSTPDPNPNNNTSTAVAQLNTSADISIIKIESPNPVIAGQLINYSMVVSNAGPSNALNVLLTDVVPATIINPQFSINEGITWNTWASPYSIGTLGSEASVTIQIRGTVSPAANGSITNTAKVSSTTSDPHPEDNTSTIITKVDTSADISVIKTAKSIKLNIGDLVTYIIVVSNVGPSNAQSVSLADTIPNEVINPQFSINNGVNWDEWVSPYNIGDLLAGFTRTILIRGTISNTALGIVINTSKVSSPTPDPNIDNNTSSVDIYVEDVRYADLVSEGNFIKSRDLAYADIGDEIAYTINVTNTGNTIANNVVIKDPIPNGTSYVLSSLAANVPVTGTPAAGINVTNGVAVGQTIILSYRVKVNVLPSPNPIPNTASVKYTYTVNPEKPNGGTGSGDSNTVTTQVNHGEILAENAIKSVDKNTITPGGILTYIVTAKNTGNVPIDAVITDVVPGGTEFILGTVIVNGVLKSEENPNFGVNVGPILIEITASLVFKVRVLEGAPSTLKNNADIRYSYVVNPTLPSVTKNTTTNIVSTTVLKPQLTLQKYSDRTEAIVGDIVRYFIKATNTGGILLQNIIVKDHLAPELSYIGNITINGIPSSGSILIGINIGTLAIGEEKIISFDAKVIATHNTKTINNNLNLITNTANAIFEFQLPGYPKEIASATSNTVTLVIGIVNIDIIKTADKNFVVLGDTISYTVKLKNTGTLDALDVIFKDDLPNEVELVSGSFSLNGIVINSVDLRKGVNIGNINYDQETIVKYTVKVIRSNCKFKIINQASVNFTYRLSDGSVGVSESEKTSTSSLTVTLGISNFKQLSIDKNLVISIKKPNIEEILEVTGEIQIIKAHLIKTPIIQSNEGQKLTGHKLIVYGVVKEVVEYTALEEEQLVHSESCHIPFTTFIVLPKECCMDRNIELKGIVEDIYFKKLDCRTLFTNTIFLVKAIVCN